MHIDIVPNRNSNPTVLLRETYREGKSVRKRTIANLSSLPVDQIESLRAILKGEKLFSVDEAFEKVSSLKHGHIKAIRLAMERLGFDKLISPRPCKERDMVISMVAWRILNPDSKLAMQRTWQDTTLPEFLDIKGADENNLYEAMDWLLERQAGIEKKIAARHIKKDSLVLYDLSSSYFEGVTCPLAAFGYNRDGVKGKLQVNYGLLTDERGCPVSVSVFEGNVSDSKTILSQITKVRDCFRIGQFTIVGDRGMIAQKQIDIFSKMDNLTWISALKTGAIRGLSKEGKIQLGLFDEKNLFSIEHDEYPGERLIACRNPELAKRRAHRRKELIEATSKELEKIRCSVSKGKLKKAGAIGVRAGKVLNKHNVAKHFVVDIQDGVFNFHVDEENVASEASLDGIYVIRTNLSKESMPDENTVRSYKLLSNVERAFRSLKTMDIKVRPIYHHEEDRVRAHIFLCMLAYYVEWHMKEALRPLLFSDEDQNAKASRNPVTPAKRSEKALEKAKTKKTEDGHVAHSFRTLLNHLGGIVRNFCKRKGTTSEQGLAIIETSPDAIQQKAFELIREIAV